MRRRPCINLNRAPWLRVGSGISRGESDMVAVLEVVFLIFS